MARRPLTGRKKAAFALVTLAVLFGVPEAFFQVREVVRASRKPRLPLEPCPYRSYRLIPGARYVGPKGKIDVNAFGLRGPETTLEPRPGVLRVACIGGSTTFGLYAANNDETWPALLDARLKAAGEAVEVLNCGAPGWTLRTSLANLDLSVWAMKPDVVVCYHAYNDLMENHEPRYHADSHADGVEGLVRREAPGTSLLMRSALFRFVRSRVRDPHDALIHKEPALHPEGEASFERNLRRLVRRCGEQRARLLLCTFPWAYRVTLEASRAAPVPAMQEWYDEASPLEYPALVEGLARYNATIRRVGQELGVPVLDLAADFPDDVRLYVSPIHHSLEGERLVSERVSVALRERGLLRR
jgi:lysophospholipase L1-like esterase